MQFGKHKEESENEKQRRGGMDVEAKMVVLKVDMHCEACKKKVLKALKDFPGLDTVDIDMKERKVTVKGKVDARKVYEAVRGKCGRTTELIFPEITKEDMFMDSINSIVNSITELFNPKPSDSVIDLKVKMHCGGCVKQIKRSLMKMKGVMEVKEDLANDKVTVKGRALDPEQICERLRQSGKYCELIQSSSKKAEEKGENKKAREEKEGNKAHMQKKEVKMKAEKTEVQEEAEREKKNAGSRKEMKLENNMEMDNIGSYLFAPYQHIPDYSHEVEDDGEVKTSVCQSIPFYEYSPELFSDEDPNACSVM